MQQLLTHTTFFRQIPHMNFRIFSYTISIVSSISCNDTGNSCSVALEEICFVSLTVVISNYLPLRHYPILLCNVPKDEKAMNLNISKRLMIYILTTHLKYSSTCWPKVPMIDVQSSIRNRHNLTCSSAIKRYIQCISYTGSKRIKNMTTYRLSSTYRPLS